MATLVGRVGVVAKGAWDSSVAYDTLDMVTYNNSVYIAIQPTAAGTVPTNTTYWQLALDASTLQPKTMSSPVTIGGESKTTVEAAVGALEDVKADKTAISSVEASATAVSAHAVGSYFINASGQFVRATSAIAVGDTIIVKPNVGYNCEQTTVGDVLEAAQPKTLVTPLTIGGVQKTTVEAALEQYNTPVSFEITPNTNIVNMTSARVTGYRIGKIAIVEIYGIRVTSTGAAKTLFSGLPKALVQSSGPFAGSEAANTASIVASGTTTWIAKGGTEIKAHIASTISSSIQLWATLIYFIDD